MERGKVLAESITIINGDRQDQYGNPEDCFDDIARLWSWYLDADLSPAQVSMMMVLLKIAREKMKHKHDNIVDACGYLGLYDDFKKGE